MNNLEKARMLLSKEILQNFIGRITGSGLNRIVGKNPENELLVGKLMSTQDDEGQDNRSSRTFISSIGTDFYVDESEIHTAEISLFPQGDFYFRAFLLLFCQYSLIVGFPVEEFVTLFWRGDQFVGAACFRFFQGGLGYISQAGPGDG